MKYLISVSGGAGSSIAACRCVATKGAENCEMIFADTGSEHPDTLEMVRWLYAHLPNVKSYWLKQHDGDIWDFFDKHGAIREKSSCLASLNLKRKVLDEFASTYHDPENCTLVTGLDWMEPERIERFDKAKSRWATWHPLANDPKLSRCELVQEVEKLGCPKQTLYDRGYPHNNCGGACVLAGISQWVGLYHDDKKAFLYAAQREKQFMELRDTTFTILRDRRGGETKNMSLFDLEARILADDLKGMRDFRSTCGCMG